MPRPWVFTLLVLLLAAPFGGQSAEIGADPEAKSAELSTRGDRMFRQARFEDAEAAYSQALDIDRGNLRAHLGMGKIASMLSQWQRATSHYSTAYQIAPRDPDAVLAFADVVDNSEARLTLLRNFLALSRDPRVEDVRARLRVAEQTRTRTLSSLSSACQPYRIPLFRIGTAASLLRARIDRGKELKLIVDTGATGIVLNASAGSEMDLEFLADAALSGFGAAAPGPARIALARSFETGGLKIANLLVQVSERDLTREADGMIGLDVFQDFLVRLDAPARALELTPLADAARGRCPGGEACGPWMRAWRLGSLLLLRGTLNGHAEGYFVLDSGSPYSMISRKLVPGDGRPVVFEGVQGAQEVALPAGPLSIQLGGRHLMDFRYATFDASGISSRHGTEIAGAIGYSLLRDMVLTIDYPAGLVMLAKSGR